MDNGKRLITAEDLYLFKLITSSEISPDGSHIIYAVQWVNQPDEKKYSNLWMTKTDGSSPFQFTQGPQVDTDPKWSPDGQTIAFLSNRGDEKHSQIYLISMCGGEARALTDLQGEISSFSWSPDGTQFLLQYREIDADALEREKDTSKKELGTVYRQIDRVFFKLDGYGYLPKERWHLSLVDAQTGKLTQLTNHPVFDDLNPTWSPDGLHIAYCSNHSSDPDLDPEQIDLFVFDLTSGKEQLISTPAGNKSLPAFSPDGKWIAYFGQRSKKAEWQNVNVWIIPADGTGQSLNLTREHDLQAEALTLNDLGTTVHSRPIWSLNHQFIYFQVTHHGRTQLLSVDENSKHVEPIVDLEGVVAQFSLDKEQQRLAYLFGELKDPVQLWVKDLTSNQSRQLISINHEVLEQLDLGIIEDVWFKGSDGNDLQGWIFKPPHFDPSKRYPAILEIHGGPLLQNGYFFMHEFYFLAAAGYVVFFCNPRGSQGYGEDHAKATADGKWGTVDYDDLMAWTDIVADKPYIDPQRLGVIGGSYGGYMTNWIIGHTHRFNAAVTARSVSNLTSMWGSSDFNWQFQQTFDDLAPYESIQVLWDRSPIAHFGDVKTPTLVIHNEQDLRCPIEQGEQVYVALKKKGVDTEFIVFPDEPHGLSRTGRTDRRIARLKQIQQWFDKHL